MESSLIFILGLCVGSFLNVVILRVREGESIVGGRSRCRSCEEPLDARDLIPVVSYLLLRGRCRRCKSVVAWQYPAVELATGFLFVASSLVDPSPLMVVRNVVFLCFLTIIFVYDLRHMLIIDRFTVPGIIFAITANLWLGAVPAWSIVAGGLTLAGFFWIQFLVSRGTWVGGGDIRMGALMGFMLGLVDGLVALFIAYVLGAIVGLAMLATGRATGKTQIPFGTFLAVGTAIVLLAGDPIIWWYLGLFV